MYGAIDGNDTEAQRAGQQVVAVLGKLDHLVHVAEDAGGAGGDLATLVGQQHAGARALDKHEAELLLELVDLH